MMGHRIVGAACLLAFAAVSMIFYGHRGRWYAEGKSTPIPSPRWFAVGYRLVQVSTLALGVTATLSDHPALLKLHNDVALMYAGLTAAAVGLFLFVWAKVSLGKEYSPCFDSLVPNRLVEAGPYARVRHPIYTANLLLLAGTLLATGSAWLLPNLLLVAACYVWAARREEAALAAALPGYREYLGRTGAFWPRLVPKGPPRTPKGGA